MASELLGAVGIVEAALAFTIYPIQELWCVRASIHTLIGHTHTPPSPSLNTTQPQPRQSRQEAAAAAKDLSPRLWGRLAAVALVGYTAALATRGRGRLEADDPVVGAFETRGAITRRFVGGFLVGVPYFYLAAVVLGAPLRE